MTTTKYHVHYGIYPNAQGALAVGGHEHRDQDHLLILPATLEIQGVLASVEGSWKCWGIHDQETDGDKSLHVVVMTDNLGTDNDIAHLDEIFEALTKHIPNTHGRWLDYAWITEGEDWSETHNVVLYKGHRTNLLPADSTRFIAKVGG